MQITPERLLIQQEETAAQAAVSEATLSRVGATTNFINLYQANNREIMLNGQYNIIATPNLGVDGLISYPFPWEILQVLIYSGQTVGVGGSTSLDLKWKPQTSGSYASIFSTAPAFNASAAAFQTCGAGQSITGFTAPVFSKTQFAAYDILRPDLIAAMAGSPVGCGLIITHRPI